MHTPRIRALCKSIDLEIDCALNDLIWKDHPGVVENLNDARELIKCILDLLGHEDDPEELDF